VKILVCGSRDWTDMEVIRQRLCQFSSETVIIQGDARGADLLAKKVAEDIGLEVESFPADWERHGRKAGPIRNRQMLDREPDLVIAFHSCLPQSRGTVDTIYEANKRGIKVEIIP